MITRLRVGKGLRMDENKVESKNKVEGLFSSLRSFQIQGLLLNLSRAGSSGTVYETTKITSKMLDAETSYMLDRYSRFVV